MAGSLDKPNKVNDMRRIPVPLTILLAALPLAQALALESATTGSQATQATVGVINSKVDTGIAMLQARLDKMSACEAQRKFYAPSDPNKDTNGCVGVGDYDLNMASTSNINLANGQLHGTYTTPSAYGGLFYGNDHGAIGTSSFIGVAGVATGAGNSVGLYGVASGNGYGVYGNASITSGGVGVRGDGASGGWGGYFTGGVNIASGQFCLNGVCTTSITQTCNWSGWRWVYGDRTGSGGCYDDMAFYCDSAGHVTSFSVAC